MTADTTALYSIDDLTVANRHVNAVLVSRVPGPQERSRLIEEEVRIEEAIQRNRQEQPRPLPGPAGMPAA